MEKNTDPSQISNKDTQHSNEPFGTTPIHKNSNSSENDLNSPSDMELANNDKNTDLLQLHTPTLQDNLRKPLTDSDAQSPTRGDLNIGYEIENDDDFDNFDSRRSTQNENKLAKDKSKNDHDDVLMSESRQLPDTDTMMSFTEGAENDLEGASLSPKKRGKYSGI